MLNKASTDSVRNTLKDCVSFLTRIDSGSKEYIDKTIDMHTEIELFDQKYAGLDEVMKSDEYINDFYNLRNKVDSLSEEINNEAKKLKPGISYIQNNVSNFNISARWLLFGLFGSIGPTIALGQHFADDCQSVACNRRGKSKKRNKP